MLKPILSSIPLNVPSRLTSHKERKDVRARVMSNRINPLLRTIYLVKVQLSIDNALPIRWERVRNTPPTGRNDLSEPTSDNSRMRKFLTGAVLARTVSGGRGVGGQEAIGLETLLRLDGRLEDNEDAAFIVGITVEEHDTGPCVDNPYCAPRPGPAFSGTCILNSALTFQKTSRARMDESKVASAETANVMDLDGQPGVSYSFEPAPSWVRFVPGPTPTYRFNGLSPAASRRGVIMAGCACLMISGINVALMGSVSSTPSYLECTGLTDGSKHTKRLIGLINAIYWVGVIIGALMIGPISDKVGRRRAIFSAGIYAMVAIPLFASLQNFGWALALRFLNGLATGSFDSVGLNWSAESIDPRMRGRAIGLQMCCAALRASQSYFLVYGISKGTNREILWRFRIAYQCVLILLVSGLVWILPESPRWLVRRGLIEEARGILHSIQERQIDGVFETAKKVDEEIVSI
ncbi:uncharacterized protein DSM5745_06822 [Aspergillus mulundensis]|uniref:Major facilitator superfamily (MFS) profile domain-containing protein n=1 Tax=Aspergillus mulundensis TaxID=1810919 RepID=A0A3D8RS90_9EURO|nr:hypothetical protein DSM5745_06822 [Aspergillus mulundensis]RDW76830.1 hypothetical protein DSM5745_06822 [Aspergillus mulundensis]